MYTLLYLEWITNTDLLYRSWNSAQSYVAAWMEGGLGENGYMHTYGLSPVTVHLKLSQHCQSATAQYKIKFFKKEMNMLEADPQLLNQNLLDWGPAIWVFKVLPVILMSSKIRELLD